MNQATGAYGDQYYEQLAIGHHYEAYAAFVSSIVPSIAGASVIDLGCGSGDFLAAMVRRGCGPTCGSDFSEHALTIAATKVKSAQLLLNDLNVCGLDASLPKFDVVCLLDVLEHLRNFAPLVETLHALMHENSRLVVTTPNSHALARFINRANYIGEVDPTHLILFSAYTLELFFTRSGFRVISLHSPLGGKINATYLNRRLFFGSQIVAVLAK